MKHILAILLSILCIITATAQPAASYYFNQTSSTSTLDGKNGRELELALKAIIYPHDRIRYDNLWDAYQTTDIAPADSIPSSYTGDATDLVYDMYAWMAEFPKFYSDNDHSQTGGFNREHAVPNSWWGGKEGNTYAYSDLHHLMPADGAANSVAKSDYPLGERADGMTLGWPTQDKTNTSGVTYVHANAYPTNMSAASHRWDIPTAMHSDYGGAANVFEPADQYKGDFARMYLYVVCAYEGELTWQTNYMFTSDDDNLTTILPWAKDLLLKWHRQDPVSDKERARNNAVESLQHNRNPFIDYPELVEYIWGNQSSQSFTLANTVSAYSPEYNNGDNTPAEKQEANLMFVFKAHVGQPFSGLVYSTNSNGAATYTSSNTAVAEVNAQTGAVTIKAVGETIITYTVAETENFFGAHEQYKIVVE